MARKLHATRAPQARLFRPTGEAHTFEVSEYRQPRELVGYLNRQTEAAWSVADTPGKLLEALQGTRSGRTAVFLDRKGLGEDVTGSPEAPANAAAAPGAGVEDATGTGTGPGTVKKKKQSKKSKKSKNKTGAGAVTAADQALDTFQKVARKYQARTEASPLAWVVAEVSDPAVWGVSVLGDGAHDANDAAVAKKTTPGEATAEERAREHLSGALGNLSVATAGPVLVIKRGENPEVFSGPWKRAALSDWVFEAQFASVERITPGNFGHFRERGVPILYAVLGDEADLADPFEALSGMREAAAKHKEAVSFVFTFPGAEGGGDLLRHLRCKPGGSSGTFAVLEDFENDYRYCVNRGDGKDTSAARLFDTLEAFYAGTLKPDELRSLTPEKKRMSSAAEGTRAVEKKKKNGGGTRRGRRSRR